MRLPRFHRNKASLFLFVLALILMVLTALSTSDLSAAGSKVKQKTFASPEEAVKAFIDAMKTANKEELTAIFGPKAVSQLSSGDKVSDRAEREWVVKAYEEKNSLERKGDDRAILELGNDKWPLPFPLVKKGSGWHFDAEAGREEILNRRIGRNELRVIETMLGYVDAQREYASRDRTGSGVHTFALKLMSAPGKKDGLYWDAKEGEEESPAGPFVAKAAQEGYTRKAKTDKPSPFHGYYFRILTAQGKNAPGGAYDYVVKGNMILGFGLVAYPAKYGSSGIMTFIVNQEGVVYQKDFGKNTAKAAASIRKYDPDKTWEKAEQTKGMAGM